MDIKQQELQDIKEQVSLVQTKSSGLEIKTADDMSKATDVLHNIRQAEKYLDEKKTSITRPLMSSLAQVRDLFRPLETNLANANKEIKSKMLAYSIEEADRVEKEKARIAKRVEKGTMRIDTAAGKLEGLEVVTKSEGEIGKSSIREIKKIRVIDEFSIPREYLMVNLPMITEAILRKGATISGVETYIEKSIVSR